MTKETTSKLVGRKNLTYDEVRAVMDEIINSGTSSVQTATFLAVLFARSETIEEITACAAGMCTHALPVEYTSDLLEIVGTDRDGSNSLNISTTSSIVIIAGRVRVAKHGNHVAFSRSGAMDYLEALDVNISPFPKQYVSLLQNVGICFLFAQTCHSPTKHVGPVRRGLGVHTISSIFGPLTNPAHMNLQVLSVYSEEMMEPLAHVPHNPGVRRGIMVYRQDELDEIPLSPPAIIYKFSGDEFTIYVIYPQDFGLTPYEKSELVGDTPQENAQITFGILNGAKSAKRDAVLLNTGAGLYVVGKTASLGAGVRLAAELINSGRAMVKLQGFILESSRREKVAL